MVLLSLSLNMAYMNLEIGWRKDMILFKNGIINILIGWLYQTQSRLLQLNLVVQFHYWLVLLQVYIIPKVDFTLGEQVKVADGPFAGFPGVVEGVNPEKGKVKVKVEIFGRSTPIELDYLQVEKAN